MQGDVLEVSAGTGRNLPYYNHTRLRSLTLTDTSRAMLVNAADKHAAQVAPGADAAHVRFELADAQHLTSLASSSSNSSGGSDRNLSSAPLADIAALQGQEGSEVQQDEQVAPAPASAAAAAATVRRPPLRQQRTFPPHSFDVVVDTFGLCSQRDPVTALKAGLLRRRGRGCGEVCVLCKGVANQRLKPPVPFAGALLKRLPSAPHLTGPQEMARVCKPGGRILLLQHGKAKASWLNRVLDDGAREHHSKWGCWWNRDIEQIVRQAGLEVDSMSRWHFGTTYLLVARPTAAAAPAGSSAQQLKAPG
jgi:methyltransferase OMS1